MPTYEYRCTTCGNRFEVFQRIGDEPLRACEVCGGELRKVFHPAGIVFKGTGFYATDSRKSSGARTDGGTKPEPAKSDAGKGDAGKGDAGKSESGASDPAKGGSGRPSAPKKEAS